MKSIKVQDLNPRDPEDLKIFKTNSPSSIYHTLPLVAAIKPLKGSAGYLASSLFDQYKTIDSLDYVNGKVTTNTIQQYLFMYRTVKTGQFLKPAQTKCTELSSGVPLALYAFKHQYDINYMDWDHEDPLFPRLVPEDLEWAIGATLPQYSIDDIRELRQRVLHEKSTNTYKDVTSNKMGKSQDPEFDNLPRLAKYMVAQTWIYNSSVRSPNMITDPLDWDNLAVAFDNDSIPKLSLADKEKKAVIVDINELPW